MELHAEERLIHSLNDFDDAIFAPARCDKTRSKLADRLMMRRVDGRFSRKEGLNKAFVRNFQLMAFAVTACVRNAKNAVVILYHRSAKGNI